jgi:uncharacterized protein YjdB
MRNVISILTAAAFAASMAFVACSSDDEEKAPAKLTLDKPNLSMNVGGMATINITAPVNTEILQAKWTSSDTTKVTCGSGSAGSSSVIVNAVAAGTATVTAKVNSGATGECKVTVNAAASLIDGAPMTMAAGDCIMFTDPRPDMSALVSSDAGVVDFVVAPGGLVVGMVANSVGTADVTFTGADGEKVTCAVTVVPGN